MSEASVEVADEIMMHRLDTDHNRMNLCKGTKWDEFGRLYCGEAMGRAALNVIRGDLY